MKGKISEIFDSVQGEGLYCGEKQLFVRFYGCNLNCKYCDTKIDYYHELNPDELFQELERYRDEYHSISFTGGEPLMQTDFLRQALKLGRRARLKNYLETNGTLTEELKEVINDVDIIAMDLKLPSSTEEGDCWEKHRCFLKVALQKEVFLKCVICQNTQKEDFLRGLELIKEVQNSLVLVLQPDSRQYSQALQEKMEQFRALCTQENITSCVIPQMHKIIGFK